MLRYSYLVSNVRGRIGHSPRNFTAWQRVDREADSSCPPNRSLAMTTPLVQPELQTSGAMATPLVSPVSGDLLDDSVRRLRVACIVWVVLWLTAILVNHLILPLLHVSETQVVAWPPVADALAVACILVSLLVYRFAPVACKQPGTLVDLSLGYELVLAFALGVINQWQPTQVLGGPPLLDLRPGPAASVDRAGAPEKDPDRLAAGGEHGPGGPRHRMASRAWRFRRWGRWCGPTSPNYVCAVLAVVPSQVLARMSRQVRRAREMGSYRLGDLIGQGGMGEVWHAHHRLLARPAAIKLIRPGGAPWTTTRACRGIAVQRFRREAEAAASLQSPHTIQLYDFGVTADGRSTWSWSCSTGIDLETLVRRYGPQTPGGWCTCCGRPATRSGRRTPTGWSTATSSPPTSTCAGSASSTTSSRCWTSGWSSTTRARATPRPF